MTKGQAIVISNLIREVLGEEDRDTPFRDDTRLEEDLGLDSLDFHDVVVAIEDTFEISMHDTISMSDIETFAHLLTAVDEARAAA